MTAQQLKNSILQMAVQAHKRTPLQAILRRGFVCFRRSVAFCAVVIVKKPSNR